MVWIPLISRLERRGGRGKGATSGGGKGSTSASGSSSSGSKSGTSSSTTSSGVDTSRPAFSVPNTGSKGGSSTYDFRGGGASTIPPGGLFAGRQQGGATRAQVYGTNVYGSGYPAGYNASGRGVEGAGFPFFFWPLVWGNMLDYGAAYLHIREFGAVDNALRPGGRMMQLPVISPSGNAYSVIGDQETLYGLIFALPQSCNGIANILLAAVPFSGSVHDPRPETVLQYYRACSVALAYEGYNNTVALQDDPTDLTPTALPEDIDPQFMLCLNRTIGDSIPLSPQTTPETAWAPSLGTSADASVSMRACLFGIMAVLAVLHQSYVHIDWLKSGVTKVYKALVRQYEQVPEVESA